MPSFDSLTQEQQDAFLDRVQQLGFGPEIAETSIVTGDAHEFAANLRYKTISSVDELKRLVGIPDSSFEAGASDDHLTYPPVPRYAARWSTYLALSMPEREELERAAYAYLFGDSSKVAGWKDVIERLLLPREISFMAAGNVTVTPDHPLRITHPSNTFGVVTIEPGGTIIVETDSTMNVQLLVKEP